MTFLNFLFKGFFSRINTTYKYNLLATLKKKLFLYVELISFLIDLYCNGI